jgi:predicted Zn finger-like uncharacterized protein
MRHDCEHCQSAYEIPDARVAGRFLNVRCQRCRGTMRVVGLRRFDAIGADGATWWCALGREPLGPYRDDEVKALVDNQSIHARTPMWAFGMRGWERVCESQALAWVYCGVIERASQESRARWGSTQTRSVFDRAALLTDGKGYFPDPTLKTGIILLDEQTQKSLDRIANVAKRPRATGTSTHSSSRAAPMMAAAFGAAAAMGGVLWFVLGATV